MGSLFFVTIRTLQEEGKMRSTTAPEVASFVLDNIDKLVTQHDCLKFLDSAAERWPVLEEYYGVLDELLDW